MTKIIPIILLGLLLVACAQQDKKVEASLENPSPVNCNTADQDLAELEKEKKNTAQRVASGVMMIAPIGLVTGLMTGTQGTKKNVASGEYNDMIDKRIAEIKSQCKR